ncbi:hypothetical protein BDZ91DRAFT_712563 [Kalaharituber pfeilii]|nr:hypothetical protein BDZ91DRAFT_712563 [Kalaharituber pfeilii]
MWYVAPELQKEVHIQKFNKAIVEQQRIGTSFLIEFRLLRTVGVCRRQCPRLDEVELYNPAALRLRATRWIHALEQEDIATVIEDILGAQGSWVEEVMKNCHDHSYNMYNRQMSRFH